MLLSICYRDTKNEIFEIDHEQHDLPVLRSFTMPKEAVHTSGLCLQGGVLWAVDYISNEIYAMDPEISLSSGKAELIQRFPTGLKRTGSLACVQLDGKSYFAVSEFIHSGRTYLLDSKALVDTASFKKSLRYSYKNGYFNQGLSFHQGHLYESNNNLGWDTIFQIDLKKAIAADDYRAGIIRAIRAPGPALEEMAFTPSGEAWITDEITFAIYKTRLD